MITQSTCLPVEPILSLYDATDGRLLYPHGCYNLGLWPISVGYWGIFRNGTRNARHLLGKPMMHEGTYGHQLYYVRFDEKWNMKQLKPITSNDVVHDVRISDHGMIGCIRMGEGQYRAARVHLSRDLSLSAIPLANPGQKNWNFLPDGWIDMGWSDGLGLMRGYQGTKGISEQIVDRYCIHLRGSAPYFRIGDRLITTYHTVEKDAEGRRSYWHYFAELEPEPPFRIKMLSAPFKFGEGGERGRIQFAMACFPEPGRSENLVVSFGVADADNVVGRIKTADVLGLLA